MNNFWKKIKKPIYALAPMAGITDSAFRQICKKFGAEVVYSEMASATALYYNPGETLKLLKFNKAERPYVVQLFGANPEHFAKAVKLVEKKIKPDGIDINFGCPVPKVFKQGAGAALMDNPKIAKEIIISTLENTSLPVSIKVRTKAKNNDLLCFLKNIKDLDIKAMMIHGRSLKQGFIGAIDYEIVKKARKFFKGVILINGGMNDHLSIAETLKMTGADGVGIARGAQGKPWIFENVKCQMSNVKKNEEIYKIAINHSELAKKLKGKQGIIEMRKHLCWYVQGLPSARRLREKLVKVESLNDIKKAFEIIPKKSGLEA